VYNNKLKKNNKNKLKKDTIPIGLVNRISHMTDTLIVTDRSYFIYFLKNKKNNIQSDQI
jgi:hypothetical protein